MPTGVVKKFDSERGFGFIRPDEILPQLAHDLFVHISACRSIGRDPLPGDRLEFEVVNGRDPGQFKAANVRLIEAPTVRYGT